MNKPSSILKIPKKIIPEEFEKGSPIYSGISTENICWLREKFPGLLWKPHLYFIEYGQYYIKSARCEIMLPEDDLAIRVVPRAKSLIMSLVVPSLTKEYTPAKTLYFQTDRGIISQTHFDLKNIVDGFVKGLQEKSKRKIEQWDTLLNVFGS